LCGIPVVRKNPRTGVLEWLGDNDSDTYLQLKAVAKGYQNRETLMGLRKLSLRSPCCNTLLRYMKGNGDNSETTIGLCKTCIRAIVRINPNTGRLEYVGNEATKVPERFQPRPFRKA
jgi:hypothetical protein